MEEDNKNDQKPARGAAEVPLSSPSPSKVSSSPSKVPASLASKSREEVETLLVSTLKKLRQQQSAVTETQTLLAARDAEAAALREKRDALEEEVARLRTVQVEAADRIAARSEQQTSESDEKLKKLKKAVVELKKRNEALGAEQKAAEAARAAAVDGLRMAETQLAAQQAAQRAEVERATKALAEYKQKAHALLKAKDEEIKLGSRAIRETLEGELASEKAARRAAEEARKAAVEELGKTKSQIAGQLHEAELQQREQIKQLQKELELQASHAKNAATRLQQLQVRYDASQQRYESLKNSAMNGGESSRETGTNGDEAALAADTRQRLDEALHALDRARAEASASAQINGVLQEEVSNLKASVKQLRMTLAMKGSIKTPFSDFTADVPVSPFSPADDGAGTTNGRTSTNASATTSTAAANTALQEKLTFAERKASAAERELDDLELEIKLRETQERALKDTIRELEGEIVRLKLTATNDGVDIEYLKNILVQVGV